MLNLQCPDSLDFRVHLAGQHIKNHFVIGNKRPKRIFESRRFIVFDEEMRKPGESITDNQTKRQVKPMPAANYPDEQHETKRCADEMQVACQRRAVFDNVKIPEFRVIDD